MKRALQIVAATALAAASVLSASSIAQDYPNRPNRMLIGFAPGGSSEAGVPGYDATFMYGLLSSARTPRAISIRLNQELRAALSDPTVNKQLSAQGLVPAPSSGEEYGTIIRAEHAKWFRVLAPIREKGEAGT